MNIEKIKSEAHRSKKNTKDQLSEKNVKRSITEKQKEAFYGITGPQIVTPRKDETNNPYVISESSYSKDHDADQIHPDM